MLLLTLAAFLLPAHVKTELPAIVARLGTSAASFDDYDKLDRERCAALPMLLSELERLPPVPSGKVGGALGRPDDRLSERTSALLRGLRILTGHDEYGPISRRDYARLPVFKEGQDGSLQRDSLIRGLPHGRGRFYGYWLSRGTSFYAPAATQRAIKAQWRSYVATFDCKSALPERRWDAGFFNG